MSLPGVPSPPRIIKLDGGLVAYCTACKLYRELGPGRWWHQCPGALFRVDLGPGRIGVFIGRRVEGTVRPGPEPGGAR